MGQANVMVRRCRMNVIVAAATAAGVLLGAYMGYGPSGIGGAIFYGALVKW
jgi:hypothetical protein